MNRKDRRAAAKSDSGAQANDLFGKAIAHHQAGRLKECIPLYRKVLMLVPDVPEGHHNLGVALKGLGKLDEAIKCYQKAIELNPNYADAHNSLGNALCDVGRLQDAADSFKTAIKLAPHSAAAHNNLGTVLLDLGQAEQAEECFRQATQLDGSYAEGFNNLGAALAAQGKTEDAMCQYDQAVTLDGQHPRAHANRAGLLLKMGRLDDALRAAKRAVALAPQVGLSQNTLGTVLQELHLLPEAAQAYALAIKAQPDLPEFHDNLGNVLAQLGRSAEAETSCRTALRLAPDLDKAHNNLGTALKDQGKRDEAEMAFRRALELSPNMSAAHTNLGMCLLYRGDFPAGWREFEWRWNTGKLAPPSFAQPRWVGEDISGKTILLTAEQGMGDAIQFARYAKPIADLGAKVILQVHAPLTRLLSTVPGVTQVVAFDQDLPPFDVYLPLMSVPLVLGTTLESIPLPTPYVSAPTVRSLDGVGLKIGLVWAGDPRPHDAAANAADRRRSIPLALFAPLLSMPNVTVYSLQMGEAKAQMDALPAPLRPTDIMCTVTDFADTAAIVAGLDLVITVDTSVAHLAGALGKPVWLLSRLDGCWRWLANRDDSPWYPTLRMFRQTQAGQWDDVIAKLVGAI